MKLNFEGLEMHKWIIPTEIAQKVNEKKCGHLSSYVYSQSYGN